jgi:hypothetical protein
LNSLLFFQASAIEAAAPDNAMQLYDEIDKQNTNFIPAVLIAGLLGPAIAAGLAYLITRDISSFQTAITLNILILGYAPIFMLYKKVIIKQGTSEPPPIVNILYYVYMPILVVIHSAFQIAVIVAISLVTWFVLLLPVSIVLFFIKGPPFPMPWTLPLLLNQIILTTCIVFWLLYVLAELNPEMLLREPLADQLEQIPAGLRLRLKDILQFFAGLFLAGLLVGAGPLELLYTNLWEAVFMSAITGLMLAYSINTLPKDPILDHFIQLGRARTLIRLGRLAEARWRLERIIFAPKALRPVQLGVVASSLHTMASLRTCPDGPDEIPGYLRAASDVQNKKLAPYNSHWQDIIKHTQKLYTEICQRYEF